MHDYDCRTLLHNQHRRSDSKSIAQHSVHDECLCARRRHLTSKLPLKRTAILVGYLISFVFGSLGIVMLLLSFLFEERTDFNSTLASWGINSKRFSLGLILFAAVTPVVDKLQQLWVDLELHSKEHLFDNKHRTMYTQA